MRLCVLFAVILISLNVAAQSGQADSLNYVIAVQNAKNLYWQYISPSTGLYNGVEYVDYAYSIKVGHPFFETTDFKNGSVIYDEVLYENVPILYDIIKDQVVINDPYNVYKLVLTSEKVQAFTIEQHKFTRWIKNDSSHSVLSTGYYEVLYEGSNTVYKRQQKQLQEETSITDGLKRYVVESSAYFIARDDKFYAINSKRAFLSLFRDKKSEVQQYMHKNKLRYKKNKANTITKVAAYYDQLKK